MKTYEETTRSVLCRVKDNIEKQKKLRARIAVACSCCVVVVALAGAALFFHNWERIPEEPALQLWQDETITPTEASESTVSTSETTGDEIRISAICASSSESQKMIKGARTPFYSEIKILDMRGLSFYERIIMKCEEREKASKLYASLGLENEAAFSSEHENGDYWIFQSTIRLPGVIYDGTLGSVDCTTTSAKGNIICHGYCYCDYNLPEKRKQNRLGVAWGLSSEVAKKIAEDPEMKLSEITDTLTVEVKFKDGHTEVVVFDFSLDDEGNVYVTQQDLYIKR